MRKLFPILGAFAAISGLAYATWSFDSWETRGQFGDSFGSVNSLLNGIALLAIIYTVRLQREELSLQRDELRLQREEMKQSRAELAAQVRVQEAQYGAAIAQLQIAARQMEIEAIKMESEQKVPSAREQFAVAIRKLSGEVDEIAERLSFRPSAQP